MDTKKTIINKGNESLRDIKQNVIGLARHYARESDYQLIIAVDNSTIDTITITSLGAIQQNFGIPKQNIQFYLFPNNKNMNEILDNVIDFNNFLKKFK